jgi:deoxyribodipyrimidine photo-lyase
MPENKDSTPVAPADHAPIVVWFRDDLRLGDNPAFHWAAVTGRPLVCIFIEERAGTAGRPLGSAARWWLHGSLAALDMALRRLGGRLLILRGDAKEVVPFVVSACRARSVFWNRRYSGTARRIDEDLKADFRRRGIDASSFNGHLLYEPWTVSTREGAPFRVFSAFWRAAQASGEPEAPLPVPSHVNFYDVPGPLLTACAVLEKLELEPAAPDWAAGFRTVWQRGEPGAQARLSRFIDKGLGQYADFRDRPDRPGTSRLSPYLRFGNISVRQIWHVVSEATHTQASPDSMRNLQKFRSELGWREFCYHQLYYNTDISVRNLQKKFDRFAWLSDSQALTAWQQGRTGYPIIDAGMRELWFTGYMHNRVRMVAASFLVKDLLIDWRAGESWFWDTLVDADPANNPAGWQWVAGCGADAAPFFRIFNPVSQGEKFDPDGTYVRQWVPELAHLPGKLVHRPWEQTAHLGGSTTNGYPARMIDHSSARQRAIRAFSELAHDVT